MREHPIPSVNEPLQYRAIGIVRGVYCPLELKEFTRGKVIDENGVEVETVILGRVLNLMKRHIDIQKSHLWIVYPRCRESNYLHLQIAGVWEPSTLSIDSNESKSLDKKSDKLKSNVKDELPEGDDYFSIRGELIYTKPQTSDLIIRVRQKTKNNGKRQPPFKLYLKGDLPIEKLRHFVDLQVRRKGQELHIEGFEFIGPIATRGGKKKIHN